MNATAVPDIIDHPPHYTHGAIEPIDVIEDWRLPHHLACVLKYIARHEHKGNALNDLDKAIWYLQRYRTLVSDDAFDVAVSEHERRLCERHDAVHAAVEPGLAELAAMTDGDS